MFFEHLCGFFLFHTRPNVYSELKTTIKQVKDCIYSPFLNSNYSISFQVLVFIKATKCAYLVTGSGLNCVTSALVCKFIPDFVTAKHEQDLDLPVPRAKLLPLD